MFSLLIAHRLGVVKKRKENLNYPAGKKWSTTVDHCLERALFEVVAKRIMIPRVTLVTSEEVRQNLPLGTVLLEVLAWMIFYFVLFSLLFSLRVRGVSPRGVYVCVWGSVCLARYFSVMSALSRRIWLVPPVPQCVTFQRALMELAVLPCGVWPLFSPFASASWRNGVLPCLS